MKPIFHALNILLLTTIRRHLILKVTLISLEYLRKQNVNVFYAGALLFRRDDSNNGCVVD